MQGGLNEHTMPLHWRNDKLVMLRNNKLSLRNMDRTNKIPANLGNAKLSNPNTCKHSNDANGLGFNDNSALHHCFCKKLKGDDLNGYNKTAQQKTFRLN